MEVATTSPARRPRLMKLTTSTMTTASFSALVKPATDSSTTTDWLATRWTPMPTGRFASTCRIRSRMPSPNVSTLPPAAMEMIIPMAGSPL